MIWELFRQELVKFRAQRYLYILFGAIPIILLGRLTLSATSRAETTLDVVNGPQLWGEAMSWGVRYLALLLLAVGSMSFSTELGQGTAKTWLMQPVSRMSWLAAKFLVLVALAWTTLLFCAILAWACATFWVGWGAIVLEGKEIYSAGQVFRGIGAALLLSGLFLLPACAYALLVGSYFHNSGAAVAVTFTLAVALEFLSQIGETGHYLFVYHLPRPLNLFTKLSKGLHFSWREAMEMGIPVALSSCAILYLWLAWRWKRLDITS